MYTATLTRQGQITLPVGMRKRSGLMPGDRLVFMPKGNNGDLYEISKVGDISDLRGSLARYTRVRRYPTQDDIAKAWVADYARKWGKHGKSAR